ncbi:alpha/beta-hydrolase, partial [Dacryopinax primogenitus]
GSYLISGTLCQPLFGDEHEGTVQLLVHGIPFDSQYWDFQYDSEMYSYVWAASAAGYTTFRYDRLGTGLSEHPIDGLNVVRADTDVQILSSIASLLRTGTLTGTGYNKILLVGHSYGSVQATALASRTPAAVDGIIATGFSAYGGAVPLFLASGLWSSAAQVAPYAYASLASTYLLPAVPQAAQMNFYYYPGYDESVFVYDAAMPQPVTVGVMFTLETVAGPASNFTGPVLLVTGAQDLPFCGGNCYALQPSNQTILQETGTALFPASKYSYYAPQLTGHNVNLHLSAPETYAAMIEWVLENGF